MFKERKGFLIILVLCFILCTLPGFKCLVVEEEEIEEESSDEVVTSTLYWVEDDSPQGHVRTIDTSDIGNKSYTNILSDNFFGAYVDVDKSAKKIYFSDGSNGTIARVNFDGTGYEVIYSGLSGVEGIALDPNNNTLYYLLLGSGIFSASMDGSKRASLFFASIDGEDIAIDLKKRVLYFVYDDMALTYISKLSLDTPGIPTKVSSSITGVVGLFFDTLQKRIYFVYESMKVGYLSESASQEAPNLLLTQVVSLNDIVVNTDKIYISTSGEIKRADLDGSNIETAISGVTLVRGMAIVVNKSDGLPINTMISIKAENNIRGTELSWEHPGKNVLSGFHIWRKREEEKNYKKITKLLIPAKIKGSSYSYLDISVGKSKKYYYKLEIFKNNGKKYFGKTAIITTLK